MKPVHYTTVMSEIHPSEIDSRVEELRPQIEEGSVLVMEWVTLFGVDRERIRVSRVEDEGVSEETVLGHRLIPWETIGQFCAEVQD